MIKFFRRIRFNLMSENKTGKYFKYAIGEIILVVIGILMALQINNWNEDRKNKEILNSYKKSLITDLEQDTLALNSVIRYIKNDLIEIEKIGTRLSSKYATKDTLIKIVRNELSFASKAYRPPNNKTFLAMQTNGKLELFDKNTYTFLLELHDKQSISESVIRANINQFLTQANHFFLKYSIDAYSVIEGDIVEKAWQNVDADDLYRSVQGCLTLKKIMNENTGKNYMDVLEATEKVISHLKTN